MGKRHLRPKSGCRICMGVCACFSQTILRFGGHHGQSKDKGSDRWKNSISSPNPGAVFVRVCAHVFFSSGAPLNARTRESDLLPAPGIFCNRDFTSHTCVESALRGFEMRAGPKRSHFGGYSLQISVFVFEKFHPTSESWGFNSPDDNTHLTTNSVPVWAPLPKKFEFS